MTKETSIYLDAVRFLAAVVVFIDHLSSQRITAGFLWPLEHLGGQAVIVFFVLSGFVIGFITDTREKNVREYAINRAARILSVALPALALGYVLDQIGIAANPEIYAGYGDLQRPSSVLDYLACALFLNEIWGIGISPGTNVAYWSLGYEVWYYAIFGAAMFAPPQHRTKLIAGSLLLVGPAIALLRAGPGK